jgi:LEA14-like dessication related protein
MLPVARPLCLLLVLGTGGCVERFIDFRVHELVGVRVTRIDGTGFDLRVRCQLENPNRVGARLSGIRFRSWTGSHELGTGQLNDTLEVPARSRFQLEVPVRIAYEALPSDFPQRVVGGSLALRTEASFNAKTTLGSYDMRVVADGRTRISEALSVAVQGPFSGDAVRVDAISLAGVELRRVRLRLRLTARNRFTFPVQVRRGTFAVAINGSPFGKSTLGRPLQLPPRGAQTLEMEISASHGTVGAAIAAMMGSEPRFHVTGQLDIEPIGGVTRVPIDVQADSSVFGR